MNFEGKKLLILAGSYNEVELVLRAKELGIYTIVTDYYSPDRSPAKKVADEYWNISWDDTDLLEKKCRENHVDGVTGGYSEFVVEAVIKLCERLGLPCYCNHEQLAVTRDKIKFKNTCRKNKVPVVNEYSSVESVTKFPVIVKPVDRAGSIGISVASNKEELVKAYDYAMEMSVCKQVIIEDYISNGKKFDVYYAIINGEIVYLSSSDTINAKNNGTTKVVQSAWTFPSKYEEPYIEKVDSFMREMLRDMKMENGFIFFSGFTIPNGDDLTFVFFECGFRLSGGHMYNYIKKRGNSDIQDIFISHALTGKTIGVTIDEKKNQEIKYLVTNFYATKGRIDKIEGIEKIAENEDCSFVMQCANVGEICNDDRAILKKIAMFHFCNTSVDALKNDLKKANAILCVTDELGNDLVYDRIDEALLNDAWE